MMTKEAKNSTTDRNPEELKQQIDALIRENKLLKQENDKLKRELDEHHNGSFKERYAVKILDTLPDMLTVFDWNEKGIEIVSNESTNHVGMTNEQFKGTHMRDGIPDDAYQIIHKNAERVKETGKASTAFHELNVNGEQHYFENRIFPIDTDYMLIMCRDISERVAIQKRLQKMKKALDNVSDAVFCVDKTGKLTYANRQFRKDYALQDSCIGMNISNCEHLWTSKTLDKRIKDIKDNGGMLTYNSNYINKESAQTRFQQVTAFCMEENGEDSYWFFSRDITDVINSRENLRELNQLLNAILNNIPICLFVKDTGNDFRYIYWNKAFSDYSHIPASQAIGKNDFEVFNQRVDAEKFRRDDLKVLMTKEPLYLQETYVDNIGETHVVQTQKTLVNQNGKQPLLIGISWDVTDLKDVEQELVRARIKAEQADRLKSAFLANMSHEIRTPLNSIVGFSSLIANTDDKTERKHFAEIIQQNSDILLQLISDILDIAKIEAGTLEYVRQPMDLAELFKNIYEIHENRMKEGVKLILDIPDDKCMIMEDKNRIAQVVTNFITNAAKFTFAGEVRMGYRHTPKGTDLFVKDTGIGIEPNKKDQIFERFVKLNSFAQGTGLGLPICKMIADKMDGEIFVESEVGKGSCFHIILPKREASENL